MALSTDMNIEKIYGYTQNEIERDLVSGAVVTYRGSAMNADNSGNVKLSSDTSGERFAGISKEPLNIAAADNGVAGTYKAKLYPKGCGLIIKRKLSGVTKANIGATVYAVDDEVVSLSTTNSVEVGVITDIAETDYCWVRI